MQDQIKYRSFQGKAGGAEHFFALVAPAHLGFREQVAYLETAYENALTAQGLGAESAVFRRIFLSDILNQNAVVAASALVRGGDAGLDVPDCLFARPQRLCAGSGVVERAFPGFAAGHCSGRGVPSRMAGGDRRRGRDGA